MGNFYGMLTEQNSGVNTIPGITTGLVKENWDKDHPGMVRVEMFLGEQGKNVTGWIPVMTNYAGKGYGNYVLPEIGSCVVIAFICGDREHPVVLGEIWDKKNTLPQKVATEKNTEKKLLTKGGSEISISEVKDKEKITITTPGKLVFSLDDEKKMVHITDEKSENMYEMDCEKGNLTLKAKKKFSLKIGDDVAIEVDDKSVKIATKDVTLDAKGTITLNGQNVKANAKANAEIEGKSGVTVKASGSLKLNSSAMLEVKGSMVKIN